MRQSVSLSYLLGPSRFSDKQVEQAVSVKMTDFCWPDKKADAAESMWASLNGVLVANGALEHPHRTMPRPIEQHRRNHQSCIEQLRQEGYSRQPSQPFDDKFEYHRFRSDNALMCSITRKCT